MIYTKINYLKREQEELIMGNKIKVTEKATGQILQMDKSVGTIRRFFPFTPPLLNVKIPNLLHRHSLSMKGSTLIWGSRASRNVGT